MELCTVSWEYNQAQPRLGSYPYYKTGKKNRKKKKKQREDVEESTYKKLCSEFGDSITLKNVMRGLGENENDNHLEQK